METKILHQPVLLNQTIDFLNVSKGERYIDATVGDGGHSQKILESGGRVLGIDVDPAAIEFVKKRFLGNPNFIAARGNFSRLAEIAQKNNFDQVGGILFDLGVSWRQLDDKARGFSFQSEFELDMRMDPSLAIKAKDLINNFDERRLDEIFERFGQVRDSRRIVHRIICARREKPIESCRQLAEIVQTAAGRRRGKIHPATKIFLALRIVVNSELENLKEALPQLVELLKEKGRLVVISFHSLEDRIVKDFFKRDSRLLVLTKKPVVPSIDEISANPKARSAKLRVAKRI